MAGSEVAKLVEGILANVKASGSRELASWRNPERDIRRLARHNYAPGLRRRLSDADLENIVRTARLIMPRLNCDHDPERIENWLTATPSEGLETLFAQVTSRIDINFQGTPFTGPEGLALRGFFLDREESLKRPLIYVNTAHHPVAVAASFFHEIGHLVASQVFDDRGKRVHLFIDADFLAHFDDLEELAADIVLTLVAYPAPIARRIFAEPWNWGVLDKTTELSDQVFAQVSEYFRCSFGVSLAAAKLPARRKLNYLAGMIHFAKLRSTLLAEYDL
jgi:hypothetical protein